MNHFIDLLDWNGEQILKLLKDAARMKKAALKGKHKPTYTPNDDVGDFVVVTNASRLSFTGKQLSNKIYYRHSGYPGGLREMNLERMLSSHPERVLEKAVRGMLPHNRLGEAMYRKLKVYAGPDHPHGPQQPQDLGVLFAGQPTGARYTTKED